MIHGIPEYPGWKVTPPQSLTIRIEATNELTIRYRRTPTHYEMDTLFRVFVLKELHGWEHETALYEYLESHPELCDRGFYEQYDFKQPDAPTGRGRARAVVWSFLDKVRCTANPSRGRTRNC